jgi:hypothetical protein
MPIRSRPNALTTKQRRDALDLAQVVAYAEPIW